MTATSRRFSFRKVGTMSYEVARLADGLLVGNLWRTRDGWRYSVAGTGAAYVDTYGISRETAASVLSQAFDEIVATHTPLAAGRPFHVGEIVEKVNPGIDRFPVGTLVEVVGYRATGNGLGVDVRALDETSVYTLHPSRFARSAKFSTPDLGMHGTREDNGQSDDEIATDEALDAYVLDFLTEIDDATDFSNLNGIATPIIVDPERALASLRRLVAVGAVEESDAGWRVKVEEVVEAAAVEYVGPLVGSDVDHPNPRLRAGQIFREWQEKERRLAAARHRDPLDESDVTVEAERAAEHARDYLIEFVDVHGLTYTAWDPRNSTPGVADHFEIRDRDGLVVATSPTIPVELAAGHTVEALDDKGREILAAVTA